VAYERVKPTYRIGNANRLEGTEHLEDPVGNGNTEGHKKTGTFEKPNKN
jgi:hypothetical protein